MTNQSHTELAAHMALVSAYANAYEDQNSDPNKLIKAYYEIEASARALAAIPAAALESPTPPTAPAQAPQAATAGAEIDTEAERKLFEADAEPMDFDLERVPHNPNVEPWDDYFDKDTGHRWGGWLGRAALRASTPAEIVPVSIAQLEVAFAALSADPCSAGFTTPEHWFVAGAGTAEGFHGIVTKESST